MGGDEQYPGELRTHNTKRSEPEYEDMDMRDFAIPAREREGHGTSGTTGDNMSGNGAGPGYGGLARDEEDLRILRSKTWSPSIGSPVSTYATPTSAEARGNGYGWGRGSRRLSELQQAGVCAELSTVRSHRSD